MRRNRIDLDDMMAILAAQVARPGHLINIDDIAPLAARPSQAPPPPPLVHRPNVCSARREAKRKRKLARHPGPTGEVRKS